MGFGSILRRVRDAISDVTPNWMPFNFVLVVTKFRRANGRFPVGETHPAFEFNDFIFWRMIRNDRRTIEKVCTDKQFGKIFARAVPGVRVAETIDVFRIERGSTLADFEAFLRPHLGRRLVAKPTHSCGPILFLDKNPTETRIAGFFRSSRSNFFRDKRETQYHDLERKIVLEENISIDGRLDDYKFYMAKGIPLYSSMVFDRFTDISCAILDLGDMSVVDATISNLKFPENFRLPVIYPRMIEAARALSREFEFVRIDLYEVNGEIYFGEFTFTPSAGCDQMTNRTWTHTFARRILEILHRD